MRKSLILVSVFFMILVVSPVTSLEIEVQASPSVFFPMGSSSAPYKDFGFGGRAGGSVILFNSLGLGAEAGFIALPVTGLDKFASLVPAGFQIFYSYYPLSRLMLRAGAAFGPYWGEWAGAKSTSFWGRAWLETGFRINPSWTLGLFGGYSTYVEDKTFTSQLASGPEAGLTLHFSFDTKPGEGAIDVRLAQEEAVFPLFYRLYQEAPVGMLRIKNSESAEIRDVTISFSAGEYTASSIICGEMKVMAKKSTVEIPLLADFSDKIFNFTEAGKVPGELTVSYRLLGKEKTAVVPLVISIHTRNTLRWMDPAALAAFVSPNAPEVLELSKYLTGLARNNLQSGLSRNMQFAMFGYEGLRLLDIEAAPALDSPYSQYHTDASKLDSVQYPFQTLYYKSGDYDEIALLYAGLLEGVGISTALIPLENDVLTAFSLGISEKKAQGLFYNMDQVLIIDDEVWLPLSASAIGEGFMEGWSRAVEELSAAFAVQEVDFIRLQDAWGLYPPAGFSGGLPINEKPEEAALVRTVRKAVDAYIERELQPLIQSLQRELASGGDADQYNRLGLLYLRSGQVKRAEQVYEQAAGRGSVKAMVNRGNLAVLDKNFDMALRWYEKALAREPDNKNAQRGRERALLERGQ